MAYEPLKYSKNKINCAGNYLSGRKRNSISTAQAMSMLSNWRLVHAYPLNKFYNSLKNRLKKIDPHGLVGQRLKRAPSIIEKLKRFDTMKLVQMQDVGGVRGVVLNINKVRKLEAEYRSPKFNHELVHWNDYIVIPKKDGYRGLHLIFKYRTTKVHDYNNLLIEIQLRTKIQHAWATAVETMDVYQGQSLKLGRGKRVWKKFFKYTSMAFSILESSNPVPGLEGISNRKIFQEVRKMDKELKVLEKLKGFSLATDKILSSNGKGVYNLVKLDLERKVLEISYYTESRLAEASEELTRLEGLYAGNGNIDVVLLSAGPLKKLKKSYPNYFLDTAEFIKHVEKVIKFSKISEANIKSKVPVRKNRNHQKTKSNDVMNMLFSGDIPQADNIDSIREIVEVVNKGIINHKDISKATGYSNRHVQYKVASAIILGFIDKTENVFVTSNGKALLQKEKSSEKETKFLKECIKQTKFYKLIASDLFLSSRPDKNLLAKRIMDYGNLSESTAYRRAGTLIAWSNRIMQYPLKL